MPKGYKNEHDADREVFGLSVTHADIFPTV